MSSFGAYFPEVQQVRGAVREDSSYGEFEVDAGAPEVETAAPAAVPPTEVPEAATGRRGYPRPLWIVALCLSAAAATVAGREYLAIREAPRSAPLLLEVSGREGEIHVTWDRSAPLVRRARGARIVPLPAADGAGGYTADGPAEQRRRGE
jgi:hypothetical protein